MSVPTLREESLGAGRRREVAWSGTPVLLGWRHGHRWGRRAGSPLRGPVWAQSSQGRVPGALERRGVLLRIHQSGLCMCVRVTRMCLRVRTRARASVSVRLGVWLPLCSFVGELGLLRGLCLLWHRHLAGLRGGGAPTLSWPHSGCCRATLLRDPTSRSPQGLPHAQILPQCTARFQAGEPWEPGGAGQSLVGLLLSDRAVRQGLGTSRQGRGGGERRRRKKKEVGSGKGNYAMVVFVTRALHCWGPWEAEKRQLKPVE